MGLRSTLKKVFGNAEPPQIAAGEAAAGMTPTRPFSPGQPIGPYDGFSRTPRSREFVTGYNISARPRTHERVAFETLRGLVEAYDVAQIAIWHRIDSIRALDWSLTPARGFRGDADAAIDEGMAVLEKPDRETPFASWLAKYLYDVLAYDAGALYRMRNRRGDVIGLRTVDGTTLAPLLDYWGNRPAEPAEAFVQYVNGLPWNWLTAADLIYEPFRPVPGSPYGRAPLETILLNANTDLRFQAYFLQRFTEGNVPEAFASAPETWTPSQIEEFQTYWDAFMLGDQAAKHQIKWIPGGSTLAWSNEKDFQDHFSLFLMRKTCAAFHVVPSDLGFTESVNRSSGETQADVQHRVGDLPLLTHVEGILTSFLRHDRGLPVQFKFDTGQEKEDRLTLAQAWKVYIEAGMASPDEGREQLLGLPGDPRRPTPRFFSTTRSGPIPLLAIDGIAGRVDPETFGPAEEQQIIYEPFVSPPGVVPVVGTTDATSSLGAEDAYQTKIRTELQGEANEAPVAKDGPTTGITAGTGIYSYDLVRHDEDEQTQPAPEADNETQVAKEMAAFRRFRAGRCRAGRWRDFQFQAVDPTRARRLNQAGRCQVRKAAGEVAVAGLAVLAADTGRVLMLQRALDDEDPAAGTWEVPGGHLEPDESPLQGAWREWSEETGCIPPPGRQTGSWVSPNGVYQGIVWTVESESCVPLDGRGQVSNPDDPDFDATEAVAWWDPAQLVGNPSVRPELRNTLDVVLAALGQPTSDEVAKAGGVAPKGLPSAKRWPGWERDLAVAEHWAPAISQALTGAVAADSLAEAWARQPAGTRDDARRWLDGQHLNLADALAGPLKGVHTDGYLVGTLASQAILTHHSQVQKAAAVATVDWGSWTPGDTDAANLILGEEGDGEGLADLLNQSGTTISGIADTKLKQLARILADGMAAGDSPDSIARAIRALVDDPSWALTVALTETTRASTAATLGRYAANGIEAISWATAKDQRVCITCIENEEASPIPINAVFPDGSNGPPGHPDCRCCLFPEFVTIAELDG